MQIVLDAVIIITVRLLSGDTDYKYGDLLNDLNKDVGKDSVNDTSS